MDFALDTQIEAVLSPVLAAGRPEPVVDDIATRRAAFSTMMHGTAGALPVPDDVEMTDVMVGGGRAPVPARWYRRRGSAPASAVVYGHGGGMIAGSVAEFHPVVAGYVWRTGVPVLSVDYRIAPEHPHPAPIEDCYAGLV